MQPIEIMFVDVAIAENGSISPFELRPGVSMYGNSPVGKGELAGEPVFVAAEGATNDDDGYLMTYVHDEGTDTSHLTILDASNIEADPIAEVHLPRRIPTGFHGSWIAD